MVSSPRGSWLCNCRNPRQYAPRSVSVHNRWLWYHQHSANRPKYRDLNGCPQRGSTYPQLFRRAASGAFHADAFEEPYKTVQLLPRMVIDEDRPGATAPPSDPDP